MLPLPLPGFYTYRVPFELNDSVQIGQRVVVQFGRKRIYSALIKRIHETPPQTYSVKYILSILDPLPIVNDIQFKLWDWIADYYMCFPGEVMNAALPSALKLASETKIVLNPDFKGELSLLNEKEYLIAEALQLQNVLTLSEVSDIVEQLKVIPLIKTLIEKGVVVVEEELISRYRPKMKAYVKISDEFQNDDKKLCDLMDDISKRAYKQLELLMSLISLCNQKDKTEILKTDLLKSVNGTSAQLKALEKRGVIEIFEKTSSRLEKFDSVFSIDSIEFSEHQQKAFDEIGKGHKEKDVVLLHGVTSSGKTEIYIKKIQETISAGKQVLFLLPEIALTTQIINRLRKYFGDEVGVYHSRYNENERVEVWNRVLVDSDELKSFKIILGARSSLFLPFKNLGLIIVDEEHDTSYKQYDPAPRYYARDAAIFLAKLHKAKVLLGSATPSIESYYNAKFNKYALVELDKRYGGVQLPEILVADIKEETKRRTMKSHFSSFLLKHIEEALENKEQVILFQNRRGFSLRLVCEKCDWTPECKNCDVTLIYHKHNNQLKCHYCGYSQRVPSSCPACGNNELKMRGFGTEKIEDELPIFFPEAIVARMDLDTTRSKHSYQKIITDFEDRRIDILVGTQMVTKGLDFDNVSVVGILNADNMISFPDFRSFERSFQQIAQVSGRAGRNKKRGKVIIQTGNPYHSVIRYAIDNNYDEMYKSQLLERNSFNYPPFHRIILISLRHKESQLLNEASWNFTTELRTKLGKRVLGPEYPIVSRVKNLYIKNVLVKIEKDASLKATKDIIKEKAENLKAQDSFKSVRIVFNVDPI